MNQKLKKLRDKCTEKQARFVELHTEGVERGEAYINAGYTAKTIRRAQQEACRLLTTNANVMAYFAELKVCRTAKLERVVSITRHSQLIALEKAKELAEDNDSPSAFVSAIREQNEMLGFHRDTAPNPEREQARKTIEEKERAELEKISKDRTDKLSAPRIRIRETG